ncbi:Ser/Thr protein phosphatase [Mycena kentingensis (nom. inval.)]|nr:Ser/Thr protein phosphatase [Mycena kentingensis (nom. inval.)]
MSRSYPAQGRILCIADIRGRVSALNQLARDANADAIIHTGDFGFLDATSLPKLNHRDLWNLAAYSPLLPTEKRAELAHNKWRPETLNIDMLSEFPRLRSGEIKLDVPVYTIWGASEDVDVIESLRADEHPIPNLHILSEDTSALIALGGLRIRVLGLGGAFSLPKLFDSGGSRARTRASTIAGANCATWTTALQIGQLVDTADRVFSPHETRLLVTHASPGRQGLLAQLALALKADFTLSAGLHFRCTNSYNDYSVQHDFTSGLRRKIILGNDAFRRVWVHVRPALEALVDEEQRGMLNRALDVVNRIPESGGEDEIAWRTCWHWNLCDVASGRMVLDVRESRISTEIRSEGFSFAHRSPENTSPNSRRVSVKRPRSEDSLPPPKRTKVDSDYDPDSDESPEPIWPIGARRV